VGSVGTDDVVAVITYLSAHRLTDAEQVALAVLEPGRFLPDAGSAGFRASLQRA
jgi:hypothetical protein